MYSGYSIWKWLRLKSSKRNCSAIIRSSFFLISLINVITQQPHIPGNECNITKKKIGEKGYEVNCNASRRVRLSQFSEFISLGFCIYRQLISQSWLHLPMKISKTLSTEQANEKNKGSWRNSLSGFNRKQAEGKKIKVGIILRIAALQVQGVEGLETVPVGNHF